MAEPRAPHPSPAYGGRPHAGRGGASGPPLAGRWTGPRPTCQGVPRRLCRQWAGDRPPIRRAAAPVPGAPGLRRRAGARVRVRHRPVPGLGPAAPPRARPAAVPGRRPAAVPGVRSRAVVAVRSGRRAGSAAAALGPGPAGRRPGAAGEPGGPADRAADRAGARTVRPARRCALALAGAPGRVPGDRDRRGPGQRPAQLGAVHVRRRRLRAGAGRAGAARRPGRVAAAQPARRAGARCAGHRDAGRRRGGLAAGGGAGRGPDRGRAGRGRPHGHHGAPAAGDGRPGRRLRPTPGTLAARPCEGA